MSRLVCANALSAALISRISESNLFMSSAMMPCAAASTHACMKGATAIMEWDYSLQELKLPTLGWA
jgi:hypothetical protein